MTVRGTGQTVGRLSDPGLEEALSDRLSFRHFVGLALGVDMRADRPAAS